MTSANCELLLAVVVVAVRLGHILGTAGHTQPGDQGGRVYTGGSVLAGWLAGFLGRRDGGLILASDSSLVGTPPLLLAVVI